MNICFATGNRNKVTEVEKALGTALLTLEDIGCRDEIPETQDTIEGNAIQKAKFVYDKFNVPCFADDTGLEVDALDGRPGVYSARYAGPQKSADDNINKLLKELKDQANRQARFITVIAYVDKNGEIHTFEGVVEGTILKARKGKAGFGYDPVFCPEGFKLSFAEMPLDQKNRISHRGQAVQKLARFLKPRM